jgi:hypothetical protein
MQARNRETSVSDLYPLNTSFDEWSFPLYIDPFYKDLIQVIRRFVQITPIDIREFTNPRDC